MSEEKGRFEQGRWVPADEPEQAPEPGEPAGSEAEQLIADASRSVHKAIDDVIRTGRHLFGTQEGRDHIEKRVRKAGEDLEQAIGEAAEAAKKAIEKRTK